MEKLLGSWRACAISETRERSRRLWPFSSTLEYKVAVSTSTEIEYLQFTEGRLFTMITDASAGDHRELSVLMGQLGAAQRALGPQAAVTYPSGRRYATLAEAAAALADGDGGAVHRLR